MRTIHRWCREGKLPVLRAGSRYRVRLADLQSMSSDSTSLLTASEGKPIAANASTANRAAMAATVSITPMTAAAPTTPTVPFAPASDPHQIGRHATVVAVGNQKGGVGKTTTTQALGAALAERGARVLLVDFDPQASLTTSVGLEPATVSPTVFEVMEAFLTHVASPTTADAIINLEPGLDLLPSNIGLSIADYTLTQRVRREYVLDEVLAPVRSTYDWILVDCPPTLSLLTINALTAADTCVIPVVPEPLVTATVHLFLNTILDVRRSKLNPRLGIAGIVLTRTEPRSALDRDVVEALRQATGDGIPILGEVRASAWVRHATAERVLLTRYKAASDAAGAYRKIAEVLAGGK